MVWRNRICKKMKHLQRRIIQTQMLTDRWRYRIKRKAYRHMKCHRLSRDNIAKLLDARFSKLVTFRALVWPSWQSCRGPWFESVHWLVEWLSNLRLKSRHSSELHRAQTLVGGDLFQTYLTIVV